jgi:hypothetical protein
MKVNFYEDLDLFYGSSNKSKNGAWLLIRSMVWRVGVGNEPIYDIYLGQIRRMTSLDVFDMVFAFLKEKGSEQNEN